MGPHPLFDPLAVEKERVSSPSRVVFHIITSKSPECIQTDVKSSLRFLKKPNAEDIKCYLINKSNITLYYDKLGKPFLEPLNFFLCM